LGGYDPVTWNRDVDVYTTVISGNHADSTLRVTNQSSVTIEGFDIVGGNADYGGGIFIDEANATIMHNQIHHNTSTNGGGLYAANSATITVITNTIYANMSSSGGGIFVTNYSHGSVSHNEVYGNGASSGGGGFRISNYATLSVEHNTIRDHTDIGNNHHGGGFYIDGAATVTLTENLITGNYAGRWGWAGGLYIASSNVSLISNTIAYNNADDGWGGGIYINRASPTLLNNSIHHNRAHWNPQSDGGGIFIYYSNGVILEGNRINYNYARHLGGGVFLQASTVQLRDNILEGNSASNGAAMSIWSGGQAEIKNNQFLNNAGNAIHLWYGARPLISSNVISGNNGSGIIVSGASPTINNNEIVGNFANYGGGIHINGSGSPHLYNNWIYHNGANTAGGIYISGFFNGALVEHNTLVANTLGSGGEGIYIGQDSMPSVLNNLIVSHTYALYLDTTFAPTVDYNTWWASSLAPYNSAPDGEHNFEADPLFVNAAAEDYHLTLDSPCIDAGLNTGSVATDFDGETRPYPENGTVDIGADELAYTFHLHKHLVGDKVTSPGDWITYTLRYDVPLAGGGVVTNAMIVDQLPLPTTFFTLTGAPEVAVEHPPIGESGAVTLSLGTLSSGTRGVVTLTVQARPAITQTTTVRNIAKMWGDNTEIIDTWADALIACVPITSTSFQWMPNHPSYSDTVTFNASITPTDATQPISYTWDVGDYLQVAGLAYGPYRAGQSPELGIHPSPQQIVEDVHILDSATDKLRIYGGETATKTLRATSRQGVQVLFGAWVDAITQTNEAEIATLIDLTNEYMNVHAVAVGNEQLLFNNLSETQIISYILRVQQSVSVPVSTGEPWHIWRDHPDLANAVDYLLVHIHPYWEAQSVENAAAYVAQRYDELHVQYPDKPIVIGETGWPTSGNAQGAAQPGTPEQIQFFEDFTTWAEANDVMYYWFEAFDEPWKCADSLEVECHWGLFTEDRWPKVTIGTTSTTSSPTLTHTYQTGGNYYVRLRSSNSFSQATYTAPVLVTPLTVTLPIREAGVYHFGSTCARLHLTETGTLETVTVTLVYTYPTAQTSNRPLPRKYIITGTGGTDFEAALSTCYSEDDLVASGIPDETALQLYRYLGNGAWSPYASTVNTMTNELTATHITSFSTWAIGAPVTNEPTQVAIFDFQWLKLGRVWRIFVALLFTLGLIGISMFHQHLNRSGRPS
jgi:parallel beta-helix repeat protein